MSEQAAPSQQEPAGGIELMEGESVFVNCRPDWSVWWKLIGLAAAVCLVGVSVGAVVEGVLVAGLLLGYVVLSRAQSQYIVTDERMKSTVGLVSAQKSEHPISEIRSVTTSQSTIDQLLGSGTVTLQTFNSDEITWDGVPECQAVAELVETHRQR